MADGVNVAGFEGSVNDERWARLVPRAGSNPYGVVEAGDCKVTVATGDRRVTIARTAAKGGAWGWGVFCEFTEATSLSLASVSVGSRWDLIVLRRNWSTKKVTPTVVQGSAAMALPSRETSPGVLDDQPLALVLVTAGSTSITQIIDLRCFSSGGGVLAMHELALGYLDHIGASVRIGPITHLRGLDEKGAPTWTRTVNGGARGYTRTGSFREPTTSNGLISLITIPDPGFPYHVFAQATVEAGGGGAGTRWNVDLMINGMVVDGSRGDVTAPWFQLKGNSYAPRSSGGSEIRLGASRMFGTGAFGCSSYNQFFTALIIPALT